MIKTDTWLHFHHASDWKIKKILSHFYNNHSTPFQLQAVFLYIFVFWKKGFLLAVHKLLLLLFIWVVIWPQSQYSLVQKRLYLFSYIFLKYNPQQRQMQCKWESEFSWDTRVSELSKLSNLTEHSWGCLTTGNAVGKTYFWSRGWPRPPISKYIFQNRKIILPQPAVCVKFPKSSNLY